MTEAAVSCAGNLTDDPEVRSTDGGIARAMFRVAVSGRREQEASFFTVIVWRDQAKHAAQSLTNRTFQNLPESVAGQGKWLICPGLARSVPPMRPAPVREDLDGQYRDAGLLGQLLQRSPAATMVSRAGTST